MTVAAPRGDRQMPDPAGSPVVLTAASAVAPGVQALSHAVDMFGTDHRHVVLAVCRSARGQRDAEAVAARIVAGSGASAEELVRGGDLARTVIAAALDLRATAVVLGLDPEGPDHSVTALVFRVLRRAPCPVVLVSSDGSAS